mgnify:CR=1 FL=1
MLAGIVFAENFADRYKFFITIKLRTIPFFPGRIGQTMVKTALVSVERFGTTDKNQIGCADVVINRLSTIQNCSLGAICHCFL